MHFTSVERVIAFVALVPGTFNYLRRRLFHPSQDSDRARVEEEISASRNCHEPSHAIVVESYKDLQSHLVSAALSADNFPALQPPKSRISTARKRTCMSLERITADTHTIHTHTSYIYKVPEFLLPLSPIGNRAGSNLAILVKRAPPSFAASPPSRTYIQKKIRYPLFQPTSRLPTTEPNPTLSQRVADKPLQIPHQPHEIYTTSRKTSSNKRRW
jgi:hypothetical protein